MSIMLRIIKSFIFDVVVYIWNKVEDTARARKIFRIF